MSTMSYRRLGESGLAVSVVGVGCNEFGRKVDADGTRAVVEAALDVGINFFDTADIYGGSRARTLGGVSGRRTETPPRRRHRRHEVRHGHGGRERSRLGCARLPALRHARRRGVAAPAGHRTTSTSTSCMSRIRPRRSRRRCPRLTTWYGRARCATSACSNFAGWQVADAAWVASTDHLTPFISAQNDYSLLNRAVEAELVPACQRFGLGVLPFFPLASGLLTGKYRRGEPAPEGTRMSRERFAPRLARANWDVIERIEEYARQRSISMLEVAIGGLAAMPAVASVIAGATTPGAGSGQRRRGGWQPSPRTSPNSTPSRPRRASRVADAQRPSTGRPLPARRGQDLDLSAPSPTATSRAPITRCSPLSAPLRAMMLSGLSPVMNRPNSPSAM